MGGAISGITKIFDGIAQIAKVVAPIADMIFPGLGQVLNLGSGLLQGAGSFMSQLDEEADKALQQGKQFARQGAAALADRTGAQGALAAIGVPPLPVPVFGPALPPNPFATLAA